MWPNEICQLAKNDFLECGNKIGVFIFFSISTTSYFEKFLIIAAVTIKSKFSISYTIYLKQMKQYMYDGQM